MVAASRTRGILYFAATFILIVAGATPGFAQSSYQTNFDSATGWTFSGGSNGVVWNVDATPSTVPGGAAQSPTNSLNYNNSTNYNSGSGTNSGTATSGSITLSGTPVLSFWCNFQTEPGSEDATFGFDLRTLTLTPGTGAPVTYTFGVTGGSTEVGACSAMGTWHQHTVALQASWGTVTIAFKFDTVDGLFNDYAGWFIDTLDVSGSGGGNQPPPPTVQTEWNFDAGLQGWTNNSTDAAVVWAADATPATVVGNPSFQSAPNSLNYNNGTDFNAGGLTNSGTATSPVYDITALTTPSLTFWCNYQTETTGLTWDKRFLEISNDNFTTTLLSAQHAGTGATGGVGNCAAMGTWHQHTVNLTATWGSIQIRYRFDTIDGIANTGAGWFIDTVQILAVGGGGTVGGSVQSNREHDNGDNGINDACGGSVAARRDGLGSLWLAALLALASLVVLRRTLRA